MIDNAINQLYNKTNQKNIKKFGLNPYDLKLLPDICKDRLHKKAGICVYCKIEFVKWTCTDENGNFLFETFQPYKNMVPTCFNLNN